VSRNHYIPAAGTILLPPQSPATPRKMRHGPPFKRQTQTLARLVEHFCLKSPANAHSTYLQFPFAELDAANAR
jgi:hypothetical protein